MSESLPNLGVGEASQADATTADRPRVDLQDVDPYADRVGVELRAAAAVLMPAMREAAASIRSILDADPQGRVTFALLEREGLVDPTRFAERYLLGVYSPRLTRQRQRRRAHLIGQWFELMGLPLSLSVEAMWLVLRLLHRAIAQLPWGRERRSQLATFLTARMREELKAQIDGQRQLALVRHRLIVALEQWRVEATDWPEFVAGAMRRLSGRLGLVALALGRPDSEARIVYEFTSPGFMPYLEAIKRLRVGSLMMDASSTFGHSPQARAWRSRSIETNPSYLIDTGAAPWAPAAHAVGIHASAAFPIDDLGGQAAAVFALYGQWPRQFEPEPARLFLQALRQVFAQAYVELGRRSRTEIIPAEVRREHLQLLSRGAVQMVYQPIVDLRSGQPFAVEALARLEQGAQPLIQPSNFLTGFGRAELNRLFVLGLRMGLRHLAQWDLHSLSLALTLNLPPSVLVHPDCVRWIQDALAATGMAPQRLMLELLEDEETSATAMRDIAIQHLAELGVRLVMDDFGSGYSNLWRLRNLPFHSVKFDRRLLADLDTDPLQQSQFLEALLAVARSLRLRTVLEGLETQDQVDLACTLGADAGQGFALSLPLLPEQVPSWAAHFEWRRTIHAESR